MKYIELQKAFEFGIGSIDKVSDRKISSDDIFYWINLGVKKFVTERVDSSIQKDEVLTEDLSTLVTTMQFKSTDSRFKFTSPNKTVISYKADGIDPITLSVIKNDYWYTVGENIYIVSTDSKWPKDAAGAAIVKVVDALECTIENVTSRLNNSLSDHILHNNDARPLRIYTDNKVTLYTDGIYTISSYELVYIKRPNEIIITDTNAFLDYTDMPDSTHAEIVKLAIELYLQSYRIENPSNSKG